MSEANNYPHGFPDVKPDSIQKAIDILRVYLSDEQQKELAEKESHGLYEYHFSLGLWIRNNFGLWEPDSGLMADLKSDNPFMHPDSASRVLLEKFCEALRRDEQD